MNYDTERLEAERDRYQDLLHSRELRESFLKSLEKEPNLTFDAVDSRLWKRDYSLFQEKYEQGRTHEILDTLILQWITYLQEGGNQDWLSGILPENVRCAYMECLAVTPSTLSIHDVGHLILFPTGFYDFICIVIDAFELALGLGNLKSKFPDTGKSWSRGNLSVAFDHIEDNVVQIARGGKLIPLEKPPTTNPEISNLVVDFVLLHELSHISQWYHLPVWMESRHELIADRDAFEIGMGLKFLRNRYEWEDFRRNPEGFDAKYGRLDGTRFRSSFRNRGEDGLYEVKSNNLMDYLFASSIFFAAVEILSETLGKLESVKKTDYDYPSATERWTKLRKCIPRFAKQCKMNIFTRYLLKRQFARECMDFADFFVRERGDRCVERLSEVEKRAWGEPENGQRMAFNIFNY